jgi:hypothetical protein
MNTMKAITLFILISILVGCSKDHDIILESQRPSTTPYYCIARGYAPGSGMGFRSTFAVNKLTGAGSRSAWVSATIELIDGRKGWIQGGISTQESGLFYQTPDGFPYGFPQTNWVVMNPKPPLGKTVTMTIYINGYGYPVINLNGVDLAYCPLQAVAIVDGDVAVESYPAYYGNFPTFSFSPAFEYLNDGVWSEPSVAISRGGCYGMEGRSQNSSLPFNKIMAGNKVQVTNNGDTLYRK